MLHAAQRGIAHVFSEHDAGACVARLRSDHVGLTPLLLRLQVRHVEDL